MVWFLLILLALFVAAYFLRGLKERYPSPREVRTREREAEQQERRGVIGEGWHGRDVVPEPEDPADDPRA